MGQLQQQIGRFEEKGARVVGLSVDSPWSHKAWVDERAIGFPLLSDFGREVLEKYGVKHEAGFPERAYFVIDQQSVVRAKRSRTRPGTSRRSRRRSKIRGRCSRVTREPL